MTTILISTRIKGLTKLVCFSICLVFLFTGCFNKDYTKREFTADELVVADFLNSDSAKNLSEFKKILERTGYMKLLGTWGTFTVFAPTNDAIQQFLAENGKSSTEEFTNEYLVTLVRTHFMAKAVPSYEMGQGRLIDSTLNGNYFTISFGTDGFGSTMIDKRSKLQKRDIICSNGIVHTIDKVLYPVNDDIYSYLLKQPQYSMMVKALTETGYDSVLRVIYYRDETNQKRKNMITLFLESDSVFIANGYATYDKLKRAKSTGNPKSKTDGLNQFVAYHILPYSVYSDQFESKNYETFNPNFMLNVKLAGRNIILNNDTINNRKVTFISGKIDRSLKNGVIQHIDKDFKLLIPPAVEVVEAVMGTQEIKSYYSSSFYTPANIFEPSKASNTKYKILHSDTISNFKFKRFKWQISFTGSTNDYQPTKSNGGKDGVCYSYEPDANGGTGHRNPYWTGSILNINNNNIFTLNFTVGPIVPATYAVSIGYKNGNRYPIKVLLDGEEIEPGYSVPKIALDLNTLKVDPDASRYSEHAGFVKWNITGKPVTNERFNYIDYYLGTVTFTTQATHVITITNDYPGADNSGSKTLILDYVRFKPIQN